MLEIIMAVCCLTAIILMAVICTLRKDRKIIRIVLDILVTVTLITVVCISGFTLLSRQKGKQTQEGNKAQEAVELIKQENETKDPSQTDKKEQLEKPSESKSESQNNTKEQGAEQEKKTKKEAPQTTIGILTSNVYHDGSWQVAAQKGYFQKALNGTVDDSCFKVVKRSGIKSALELGQLSLFIMSGETFIEQKKAGMELKAAAVLNTSAKLCAAFNMEKNETETIRAAYAEGTTQQSFFQKQVCQYQNWLPEECEHVSDIDMDTLTALTDGKADIAVADAVAVHLAAEKEMVSLGESDMCQVNEGNEGTNTMKLLVVSDTFLDENPQIVQGFIEALNKAYADIQKASEQGSAEIISLLSGGDESLTAAYQGVYGEEMDYTNFNPEITEEIKDRLLSAAGEEISLESLVYEKESDEAEEN